MKITLDVPANVEAGLAEIAARLNVSIGEVAEAAVRDLVAQSNEDFDRVASKLLDKNRDLYRRLA
jgi:hypothetical protein